MTQKDFQPAPDALLRAGEEAALGAGARKENPVLYLHLIGLLFVVSGLTINPLKITKAFFSDEAVYYTMAYSFAYDHDMVFAKEDLLRSYKEIADGPRGIILKINERDHNLVFGKAFLYSLIAAPFVRVCGTNGFSVLHGLLLWLNLLCGYRFCSSFMRPRWATLFSTLYFLANASLIYLLWMTPEYFNMSLVCYAFFFFMTARRSLSKDAKEEHTVIWPYLLSAFFFALATYSKPTNALLALPPGLWMFLRGRWPAALLTLAVYILVTLGLFGANVWFTGQWNYQTGHRFVFYDHFPHERPGASPFASFKNKKEIVSLKRPPFYLMAFLENWEYFFFGRFSGFAVYFFPLFFGMLYFWFVPKNSLSLAAYIAGWIGVLTYMIGIPWNYFGGSGTLGNRYLMNAFSIFLFAIPAQPSRRCFAVAFCCSLLFTSAFLFSPVLSSYDSSFHQKNAIFNWLPVEKTLVGDLPNTDPRSSRIAFDQPPGYFVYFVDDNIYFRETFENQTGFWVKGGRSAQIVLRTLDPVTHVHLKIKSLQPNRVTVSAGGGLETIDLKKPVVYERDVRLSRPFPYDRESFGVTYIYIVTIQSESGAISTIGNPEERYLGCFVRIDLPAGGQ
jgi:hypothetical protein